LRREIRRDHCVECGAPVERGHRYCRDHLKAALDEARDRGEADPPEDTGAVGVRLLVIVGPTGTGKSETAVLVAESLGGEIVGCDALQVYRGLDVATAKPSRALEEQL
jgi:DNA polymerase III delta prime subunit